MERSKKIEVVETLAKILSDASIIVVNKIHGLNAQDVDGLRRKAREAQAGFMVTKNTLVRIALKDSEFSALNDFFSGQTAIAYSQDPVAAAKLVADFAKANEKKLQVVGAVLGSQVFDAAQVNALASLPSLDELRAKLIAVINTPATRIAGVLQAPAGQLARVLSAYAEKSN